MAEQPVAAPDVGALAREMLDAYTTGRPVTVPPSAREGGCDLQTGYAIEAELARLRREGGRSVIGRKIGLANRAVWRALKLKTLVWASMYDDTVHFADNGYGTVSVSRMRAPRIEPEVLVKLGSAPLSTDPAAVLESVDSMALAFEIVDCPYPDWKFQPGDFMASLGLHAALVVGTPRPIAREEIPALVDTLAGFTARLSKDGVLVEQGGGKNVLGSPALCLAEFASAVSRQPGADAPRAGDLISTGSMTVAPPVAAGERWTVEVDSLGLAPLTVEIRP
jgi:2-oxo-3-hexenedioate decarboxylase